MTAPGGLIKLAMSDLSFRRVWFLALSARVAARAFVFNAGEIVPTTRPPQSEIEVVGLLVEPSGRFGGSCCKSTGRSFASVQPAAPQLDTVSLCSCVSP